MGGATEAGAGRNKNKSAPRKETHRSTSHRRIKGLAEELIDLTH